MTQLNYKVAGPVITEKEFVKNKNGNYVLSYNVSPAKINKGRDSRIMSLSELTYEQVLKAKKLQISNKSQILNVLNSKPCN